jgi:hypothetical protein
MNHKPAGFVGEPLAQGRSRNTNKDGGKPLTKDLDPFTSSFWLFANTISICGD